MLKCPCSLLQRLVIICYIENVESCIVSITESYIVITSHTVKYMYLESCPPFICIENLKALSTPTSFKGTLALRYINYKERFHWLCKMLSAQQIQSVSRLKFEVTVCTVHKHSFKNVDRLLSSLVN